jgi:hypothetical protein
MDNINESIKSDQSLNEEFQKILSMYKPQAPEVPTYEVIKQKVENFQIQKIFKVYDN